MLLKKSKHQLVVGGDAEVNAKSSILLIGTPRHKNGRVRRMPSIEKFTGAMRRRSPAPYDALAFAIHIDQISPADFGACTHHCCDHSANEIVVCVIVVGVNASDDFAGCQFDSAIEGIVDAIIAVRHHPDAAAVCRKDIQRTVRRATVFHDVLQVRILLRKNAFDRIPDELAIVENGGDDRNLRSRRRTHRGNASFTPPSTGNIAPVVFADRALARNSAASATSSAVTSVFSSVRFR